MSDEIRRRIHDDDQIGITLIAQVDDGGAGKLHVCIDDKLNGKPSTATIPSHLVGVLWPNLKSLAFDLGWQ